MNLRRWDVVFVRADESDPTGHPAVVLSGENTLDDSKQHRFNVVVGTKNRPPPPPLHTKCYSTQPTAWTTSHRSIVHSFISPAKHPSCGEREWQASNAAGKFNDECALISAWDNGSEAPEQGKRGAPGRRLEQERWKPEVGCSRYAPDRLRRSNRSTTDFTDSTD